jgi:hypothetical protein
MNAGLFTMFSASRRALDEGEAITPGGQFAIPSAQSRLGRRPAIRPLRPPRARKAPSAVGACVAKIPPPYTDLRRFLDASVGSISAT